MLSQTSAPVIAGATGKAAFRPLFQKFFTKAFFKTKTNYGSKTQLAERNAPNYD
jgi:hypothetical protein